MPAIVRQTLSKNLAKGLLGEILGSEHQYYIGIGKADLYNLEDTVIDPIDSPFEEKEFRNNLQSIKKIEGATFVTKRYNWSSGTQYSGWSDSLSSDTESTFYVINDAKEVYLCLETGIAQTGAINVSTIEPNYGVLGVDYTQAFTTGDGYTWKFLFSLTPESIFSFLSSNYIPVHQAEDLETGDPIEDLQFYVKQAAVGGEVIRCEIIEEGVGFSVAPTVEIVGDGIGATAVAYINAQGHISKIQMTSFGSGYTHASVKFSGDGINAIARTVITDSHGIGFDAIQDLKTTSVMMNIKPDGEEEGSFIVENEFRQIGVLKNPLTPTGSEFSDTSARVLPTITLIDTSPFTSGKLFTGSQSGAIGFINQTSGNEIVFHQNETTGYGNFQVGEVVTQVGVGGTGTIANISEKNNIDRSTGDVLYIENRHRIRRDAEQQEDIKVVITV